MLLFLIEYIFFKKYKQFLLIIFTLYKKGVPAYIIREGGTNPSKPILDKLDQLPEYRGNFLSAQEALVAADSRSLVVVVDTNRPEQIGRASCRERV